MFVPPDSGPKGPVSLFGNILVILTTGSESKSQYIPLKLRRQRTMDYYTAKLEEAKNTSQSLSCPPSPAKSVSSVASSDAGPEQQLPPIQWTTTAMLCFLGSPKTWVVPKTINGMR